MHRQWEGDGALLFPSGHTAMAAAALIALLASALRPSYRAPGPVVACLTVGDVLVIAIAILVETVHPLTDVLGGIATGLVVTLGAGLAFTATSGAARSGERCSGR